MFILFAYASRDLFLKKWFKLIFFSISSLLLYYNQVIHFQFYENILNWCEMDRAKFMGVFIKTHPAYKYANSGFWDLSGYEKRPYSHIQVQKTLAIDESKARDTFSFYLPPLDLYQGSLLLDLSFSCRMDQEINESFLQLLITTNQGEYIDLQHLLLKRKVNKVDQYQEFNYELMINRPIPGSKIHFSLESTDDCASTQLEIREIRVSRIDF
jgi:hypothetical protein